MEESNLSGGSGGELRPANPLSDKAMADFVQNTIGKGLKGIREEWTQVAGMLLYFSHTLYLYIIL